jgi:hypothetical protein
VVAVHLITAQFPENCLRQLYLQNFARAESRYRLLPTHMIKENMDWGNTSSVPWNCCRSHSGTWRGGTSVLEWPALVCGGELLENAFHEARAAQQKMQTAQQDW